MTIIIIFLSTLFAAIFLGIAFFIKHLFATKWDLSNQSLLNSPQITIASSLLLVTNLACIIKLIIEYANIYNDSWMSNHKSFEIIMQQSFTLTIYIAYIIISIALFTKSASFSITASTSALVLTIINAIFLKTHSLREVYHEYFDILPHVMVILSLIIILAAICGQENTFYRYQKLLKVSPLLLPLGILCISFSIDPEGIMKFNVFNALIKGNFYALKKGEFVFESIGLVISCIAFYLIFNALASQIKNKESSFAESFSLSGKEKLIVIISLTLSPLLINVISSFEKIWLFCCIIILLIGVPIAIAVTENSKKSSRAIAIICTITLAVGVCVFAKLIPSKNSNGPGTCGICGGSGIVNSKMLGTGSGIQYGFDTYYRCAGCRGSGTKQYN